MRRSPGWSSNRRLPKVKFKGFKTTSMLLARSEKRKKDEVCRPFPHLVERSTAVGAHWPPRGRHWFRSFRDSPGGATTGYPQFSRRFVVICNKPLSPCETCFFLRPLFRREPQRSGVLCSSQA